MVNSKCFPYFHLYFHGKFQFLVKFPLFGFPASKIHAKIPRFGPGRQQHQGNVRGDAQHSQQDRGDEGSAPSEDLKSGDPKLLEARWSENGLGTRKGGNGDLTQEKCGELRSKDRRYHENVRSKHQILRVLPRNGWI